MLLPSSKRVTPQHPLFLPASRDAGNRIAHGTTILLAFVKDKEI
jgi:hypothetical protein